ncbi:MAG TPA: UxaA family hydrolase [Acidobacteriaceae bacterium]|nr:UxaA family hydrolase [Acidobacteriaceae bacterium]
MANRKVLGYRRENGRVGVRNHVIILPVDDISNAACEAVANNIKGTMALPHAYGRLQFGEDLDLHFRTMIGTGSNANVAAVVVIGIEAGWTKKIVDGIAATGKPVKGFSIEGKGDTRTIADASYQAKEYVQWASELQRTECDLHELYISVKCGESDTTTGLASCPAVGNVVDKHCALGGTASFGETSELTGAEHIVAAKAANDEVRKEFMAAFDDYTKLVFDQRTNDLSESQPTKGNIAGGLTTIEEKALGNVEKLGKKTKFVGCLPPAVAPTKPGLWFMDTSSAAAEAVTLWAASGAVVHLFPTGQGNVIGNPIEPVIKLTGNPRTMATMAEHIDLDVSKILQGEMTVDEAGDALLDMIVRTANGRLTAAEALGHREFSMTKLYRSA